MIIVLTTEAVASTILRRLEQRIVFAELLLKGSR
jgi:hypothetical protein